MKHHKDYEGGETWEEEQAAQDDAARYSQAAPYDNDTYHEQDSGYPDDEQGDDIDEEDRILAQTRAALQDYEEQSEEPGRNNDADPDREAEEGFYPYSGGQSTRQGNKLIPNENPVGPSRRVPHEKRRQRDGMEYGSGQNGHYSGASYPGPGYPGPTPQYDPYTGRRLTPEQQRSLQGQEASRSYQHLYHTTASESTEEDITIRNKKDRKDKRDKTGKRNRRAAKKREKQHYSYADAPAPRRRKKHHPVRNFFLILLLIVIVVPLLWILVQVRTMQSLGMDNEQIQESIADTVKENVANGSAQGEYKNIAILGVDSVDNSLDSGNNRSDVMIIASVNYSTGAIRLMSVYRDTYLDIGDGNYQKANAAYAYGGPDQTVQMLNRNLDLDITDYGVVGFEGIARLIDAVGGVEIDVQEDEIVHLNNYQITMSEETGLTNIPVTHAGTQTLNGLQATAYCRIRYTSGNDFRRTERQRTVLTKTFEKIKANPARLIVNLNSILPYVKTSLSVPELFSLGLRAMNFNVESQEGFPSQDLLTVGYINQQSCIIPITLARNVTWLHSELFGETDYQPSQTVQDISAHISAVTGYY